MTRPEEFDRVIGLLYEHDAKIILDYVSALEAGIQEIAKATDGLKAAMLELQRQAFS